MEDTVIDKQAYEDNYDRLVVDRDAAVDIMRAKKTLRDQAEEEYKTSLTMVNDLNNIIGDYLNIPHIRAKADRDAKAIDDAARDKGAIDALAKDAKVKP